MASHERNNRSLNQSKEHPKLEVIPCKDCDFNFKGPAAYVAHLQDGLCREVKQREFNEHVKHRALSAALSNPGKLSLNHRLLLSSYICIGTAPAKNVMSVLSSASDRRDNTTSSYRESNDPTLKTPDTSLLDLDVHGQFEVICETLKPKTPAVDLLTPIHGSENNREQVPAGGNVQDTEAMTARPTSSSDQELEVNELTELIAEHDARSGVATTVAAFERPSKKVDPQTLFTGLDRGPQWDTEPFFNTVIDRYECPLQGCK